MDGAAHPLGGDCPLCEEPPGVHMCMGACVVCVGVPVRFLTVCLVPFPLGRRGNEASNLSQAARDTDRGSSSPGTQTRA